MRKLFRMYHEPCRGTCYANNEVLNLQKFSNLEKEEIISKFIELHDSICGDSRWALGIDEQDNIFVGHVRYPDGIELLMDNSLRNIIDQIYKLTKDLLNEYDYKPDLNVCDHGSSNDLREFWLIHG